MELEVAAALLMNCFFRETERRANLPIVGSGQTIHKEGAHKIWA